MCLVDKEIFCVLCLTTVKVTDAMETYFKQIHVYGLIKSTGMIPLHLCGKCSKKKVFKKEKK